MNASVLRRDAEPKRTLVWLLVGLAHAGLILALLLSTARSTREFGNPVSSLTVLQPPNDSARHSATKIAVRMDASASHPSITVDLPLPQLPVDDNAITLSPTEQQPRIDWNHESSLAVESSIARAAREANYRDLSSLTSEQLAWVKENHMEPAPGFKWDRNSRRELLRHGIIKLNDYCVLILVIPFCRCCGAIQYDGDLFKDMHDAKSPDR